MTQQPFQPNPQGSYVGNVYPNQAQAIVPAQQPQQQPTLQQQVRPWQTSVVPQPQQQQQQQPRWSPHPLPPGYNYGWYQDPMAIQIVSNPVPVRPQFEGESGAERFFKNVALGMAEAFFVQCILAVRQAVFPPSRSDDQ
jgi:hypothetical protein